MSTEEKKVIFYTNLCRLKPKLFEQTEVEDYVKKNKIAASASLSSLKEELNSGTPMVVLKPDKEIYTAASAYALKMGSEGKTGHEGFQDRMKGILTRYNRVGENCSYGDSLAIDCVLRLLIDNVDPVHLQHRKNMLDPNFTVIGVSKQPHKTYRWNIVMDFAGEEIK